MPTSMFRSPRMGVASPRTLAQRNYITPKHPLCLRNNINNIFRRHSNKLVRVLVAASSSDETPPLIDTSTPAENEEPSTQPTEPPSAPFEASVDTSSAPTIAPSGPVTWRGLLQITADKVVKNIWPLLLVHAVCDALIFCLHRLSHRLTNELAVNLLGGGALTPAAIGNMWWLSADSAVANFQTGYQILTVIVFLLAFPVNMLLKTFASCATILICRDDVGETIEKTPWWRPIIGMWRAVPAVRGIWPTVSSIWTRVFTVELLVSAAAIPLQFASLALFTLPLTLPIILALQAAAPAAVLEERSGIDAIKRSRDLVKPIRWTLAIPFVGLVVGQRLAEALKGHLLASMPPRFYKELIEIPGGLLIGGLILSVLLSRMQDVLPYAAFSESKRLESNAETSASSSVVQSGEGSSIEGKKGGEESSEGGNIPAAA